jgi:plastocyanin
MLHVDTGEVGTYEFGTVEGADTPVTVDGEVLVFPIDAEAGMMMSEDMGAAEEEADEEMSGEMGGEEVSITIADFAFQDGSMTVSPGTTITWTNEDGAAHTVTAEGGAFDSGNLNSGDTFSFTFEEPGTYNYFCQYHGSMTGTITVE